ncbi:hypothetical protein IJG14_06515, partial [bacterium]|nr:hypothetical protein [bacterium]
FLLAFYIFYAVKTVKKYCCDDDFCENKCEELILFKFFKNICKSKITLIFIQLFFSAFALMLIANVFVENIKSISNLFHINALLISLFLAPMATELPETINGLVWSSKNKDTLAISNITGAMVFQACIPMSIGIVFTDWSFSFKETINIFCVYMAIAILFVFTRNKIDKFSFKYLIFSIIPYVIYLLFVFANYF